MWRALYVEHEPQVKNRHAGILGTILSTHFKGTIGNAEFAAWSSLIREYESTSKDVVADNIRHATILNGMGDCPLKEHLQLNGDKYPTSDLLLKGIETYFQSKRTWGPGAGTSSRKDDAMELDALQTKRKPGKGKEKGKGKGKEKGAPRTPRRDEAAAETRSCHYCNRPGHLKADCRKRLADEKAAGGAGKGKPTKKKTVAEVEADGKEKKGKKKKKEKEEPD